MCEFSRILVLYLIFPRTFAVVYRHGSSRISGGSTESDVSHVIGSDRVRMRNRFPCFFLTIVVVQNVSLRMTDMTTGCDVT